MGYAVHRRRGRYLPRGCGRRHRAGSLPGSSNPVATGQYSEYRAVKRVYRTGLLGPSGQNDLAHYETRLRDALDEESRSIAMEILAEAATQGVFTPTSRTRLGQLYSRVVPDAHGRITEVLDVLEHDGYLEARDDVYRFQLHPLRDWWAARFRNHHVPIADRSWDTAGERAR